MFLTTLHWHHVILLLLWLGKTNEAANPEIIEGLTTFYLWNTSLTLKPRDAVKDIVCEQKLMVFNVHSEYEQLAAIYAMEYTLTCPHN